MLQQGLCSGASQPAMGHVHALTWDAPFLPILRVSGPCVDGTRPSVGHRADPSCRGARMPESLRGTRPDPRTQSVWQGSVGYMRRCAYTRCPQLIPNGERYCSEHNRARDHRRSNRPQHTQQHPCHNWSHHEHQPPIPQRLAQGTTTQTSTRRIRRVRDLRATSRQNTAHTTPVERRGRRDHPGITRR